MGCPGTYPRQKPSVAVNIQPYCRPTESLDPCRIVSCCDKKVALIQLLICVSIPDPCNLPQFGLHLLHECPLAAHPHTRLDPELLGPPLPEDETR